jgi:hypothetical protein
LIQSDFKLISIKSSILKYCLIMYQRQFMTETQPNVHILLLSASASKLIPNIEKLLVKSGVSHVVFHTELHMADADLIFMDHTYAEKDSELYSKALTYVSKLCILVSIADFEEINRILNKTHGHHLFGLSSPNSLSDIKDFIIYWIGQKKWSAEMFVPVPIKITSASLNNSQNLNDKIEELLVGHDFSKSFSGIESFLTHILNEALFNAFFNAPVDNDGNYIYREKNRSEIVHMIPGKDVEVNVYSDAKKFVVSVKDQFGSITENDVFEYLPNGEVSEKAGGAGIGMHLIFKYAHKYIINVEKGVKTEVLVVIENDKQYKIYDLKEKSFHLFLE